MIQASQDYSGPSLAALQRACADASAVFAAAGFDAIDPGSVLEAENLLDLYGEDVRGRAFVFEGGEGKDLCLRPDLTLAICRHHLGQGGGAAKYVAAGPVYRRPSLGETRPAQFVQVGCEWFGAEDAATADAQTFKLVSDAVRAIGVEDFAVETGDLGVLFALIDAAAIPERWRARLKRHVWRPSRFAALLEDYASPDADDPGRHALLKAIPCRRRPMSACAVPKKSPRGFWNRRRMHRPIPCRAKWWTRLRRRLLLARHRARHCPGFAICRGRRASTLPRRWTGSRRGLHACKTLASTRRRCLLTANMAATLSITAASRLRFTMQISRKPKAAARRKSRVAGAMTASWARLLGRSDSRPRQVRPSARRSGQRH